jgi:hypothetical protein
LLLKRVEGDPAEFGDVADDALVYVGCEGGEYFAGVARVLGGQGLQFA